MRESRDSVEDVRAEACNSDREPYGHVATAGHSTKG
jgi:hypothetical protein